MSRMSRKRAAQKVGTVRQQPAPTVVQTIPSVSYAIGQQVRLRNRMRLAPGLPGMVGAIVGGPFAGSNGSCWRLAVTKHWPRIIYLTAPATDFHPI